MGYHMDAYKRLPLTGCLDMSGGLPMAVSGAYPRDPSNNELPVGAVFGNVGSYSFKCAIVDDKVREMDYVAFTHPSEGWILGIVSSIELQSATDQEDAARSLYSDKVDSFWTRVGKVDVIGRRDPNGKLIRPLTPVPPTTKVFRAHSPFLSEVLGLSLTRDKGIYMGKISNSGVDVVLDPEIMVQRHVSVIAKTGSGKSYACGVLIEELSKLDIPVLVLDLHGEYSSLVRPNIDPEEYRRMAAFGVQPRGLGDRIREFSFGEWSGGRTTIGLDVKGFRPEELLDLMDVKNVGTNASLLYNTFRKVREVLGDDWDMNDLIAALEADPNPARWSLVTGLQHLRDLPIFSAPRTPLGEVVRKGTVTVLDLSGSSIDIQQIGVAALVRKLFQARKEGMVPPFMLVVEEAHNFCPQGASTITSEIMRSVASEGRKFGLGLCIVTQRPARVDKNVLSQCGTQILMKVTNPNDLKAVISSAEGLDSRMADEVQMLPIGTAIVVGGGIDTPILTDIRVRQTRHGGDAAKIGFDEPEG
jgi:DNA helicase HerA-like ATPase